jgi:hypothetical protein
MILIAVIAVLAAALRTASMVVTLSALIVVLPYLGMIKIRAYRRRRRGRPMPAWDRVFSMLQMAVYLPLILYVPLNIAFFIYFKLIR